MTSAQIGKELSAARRLGRRAIPRTFTSLVLIAVALLVLTSAAQAGEVHVRTGTIGAPGPGNGKLSLGEHSGIAASMTTGDVYVSDTGNHRVEEFESGGTFVRVFAPAGDPGFTPTSIAVDNSGGPTDGDVYVADSSTNSVFKFQANGTQITEWVPRGEGGFEGKLTVTKLQQVAVGPLGELYVTEPIEGPPRNSVYKRYEPSGLFVGEWTGVFGVSQGGTGAASAGLALDPEGHLYAGQALEGNGVKLNSSAEVIGVREVSLLTALATDPANGDLYLAGSHGGQKAILSYGVGCGTTCGVAADVFGEGELSNPRGIAVGPAHVVYVADAGTSTIAVYGTEVVEPPRIVGPLDISEVTANGAHASGSVDPQAPVGEPSPYKVKFYFECWRLDGEGNRVQQIGFHCGGAEGEIPADSSEHAASGNLTGLSPLTSYEAILLATNRGGSSEESETFTTIALPATVQEIFATGVSTTAATLNAGGLNPQGAETSYFFEYAPEAEGLGGPGTRVTPTDTLAAGLEGEEVSARITELKPETPYVYRLVASNAGGPLQSGEAAFDTQSPFVSPGGSCANDDLRSGFGAFLPDCRAYELASPADKGGLNVEGFADLLRAAPDPSGKEPAAIWYSQAETGFPASGGAHQEFLSLLSSREGESWSTRRLSTPEESVGERVNYLGSSPDLRYSVLVRTNQEDGEVRLLLVDTASEASVLIAQVPGTLGLSFAVDAVAEDGSWVLFESLVPLSTTVAGASGKSNLYRWEAATGKVSLVGIRPTGSGEKEKTLPGGSFGGAYDWESGELTSGGGMANLYVEAIHAASPNGDQIYFTAGETGQLYLRRGLSGAHPSTVKVSTPQEGVHPAAEHPAAFQEATPDGSYAFFRSSERLTANATTGPSEEGRDLYRWDEATEEVVDVTPDLPEEAAGGARVEGLLGAGADGSSGYFVAEGDLAEGATAGKRNLYRFEEGESGGFAIAFVALLGENPEDAFNWSPTSYASRAISGYRGKSSRVTPDGEDLVFTSRRPITGYDNDGCGAEERPNEECGEIFMYATATGKVVCLSCDPTGSRPAGSAELTAGQLNANLVPSVGPAAQLTRNVSDDGDRVFFQTPDSLVSRDENGPPDCSYGIHAFSHPREKPSCMDVYEWEAPGAPGGSCTHAEANGGCLYLLSSGASDEASYFVDASAEGDDVFIATVSQLVPLDKDQNYDLYDVHAGGGLATQQNSPPSPCESSTACRAADGATAGSQATPGTLSFQGPGNVAVKPPASCKRGFVRKHGKCVKKPKKHAKAKSKSKKGKAKKKSSHSRGAKGGNK